MWVRSCPWLASTPKPSSLDIVLAGQGVHTSGQVIVERADTVGHRHRHGRLTGLLTGGDDGGVDRNHLGDVRVEAVAGAVSDLLGAGHQQLGAYRQLAAGLLEGLQRGQGCRHAGLVVQVPGADESVVGDQRMRQRGDEVADVQTEVAQILDSRDVLVEADLDVLPGDALRVDLFVPSVPGCLQRQDLSGVDGFQVIGEHPHRGTLGEPRRMVSDRFEFEAAIALEVADHRADGVGVHDDCPAGLGGGRPAQLGHDRSAPGDHEGHTEAVQPFADVLLYVVGPPGRAGDIEQFQQHLAQEAEVDIQGGHPRTVASPAAVGMR